MNPQYCYPNPAHPAEIICIGTDGPGGPGGSGFYNVPVSVPALGGGGLLVLVVLIAAAGAFKHGKR